MYTVRLASCGNPDFGQDPERPLPGVPCRTVRVDDFQAASLVARAYIRHHELGGGNWSGGEIRDLKSGVIVARVSCNGRVWSAVDEDVCLYSPFGDAQP